jgi:pyruvate/2-oxoglutarate dehydrogenase complex dihydrolipoamide acyltransferase (E2) component
LQHAHRDLNQKNPAVSVAPSSNGHASTLGPWTDSLLWRILRGRRNPMLQRHRFNVPVLFCALVITSGCGGSKPEPAAPPSEPAAEAAPTAAEPAPAEAAPPAEPAAAEPEAPKKVAWADMTEEQKKEHMKTVVLPGMQAVFKEFDPKEFAEINCGTCHGEAAKKGEFDMPNPKLPKLDPTDGFAKHMKKEPKITKFMMERVAPEMAKLLDVPPMSAENQQGFGCFNCHTTAKK